MVCTRLWNALRSLAAVCALAAAAGADVLVVDAAGGGDFLDIQPAVDAASDGDTILVRGGVYGPFAIVHQELAVVADSGAGVTVSGQVTVTQTLVQHEVLLVGLRVRTPSLRVDALQEALVLAQTRGPVRVEACELHGASGIEYSLVERGGDALHATEALDVSLMRCSLQGGDGAMSFSGFDQNRGGDGIRAQGSRVAVHDSAVAGGDGGPGDFYGCDYGGDGGHGARLFDSFFFASGSSFAGGDGGGDDFFVCRPGGHGLYLIGGLTEGYLLDLSLQGGLGACGAPNGRPLVTEGGATANSIGGCARRHSAPNPVREGELANFVFHGEPGDEAFLLRSTGAELLLVLPLNGVLLLELPLLAHGRHPMGVIPPSGTLVKTILIPALPAGVEASKLHLQSLFRDAAGGGWLASPSTLVVLDASL